MYTNDYNYITAAFQSRTHYRLIWKTNEYYRILFCDLCYNVFKIFSYIFISLHRRRLFCGLNFRSTFLLRSTRSASWKKAIADITSIRISFRQSRSAVFGYCRTFCLSSPIICLSADNRCFKTCLPYACSYWFLWRLPCFCCGGLRVLDFMIIWFFWAASLCSPAFSRPINCTRRFTPIPQALTIFCYSAYIC